MTSVDYHVHSSFSPDARDDMRKMVEKAVSLNLEEIMFTDHFEFLSDGRPGRFCSSVDYIPRIVDEVIRLRDEYSGRIYVGLGLEIGQMQFAEKESKEIVNSYPFDFILASYHKVHDVDLSCYDYLKTDIQSLVHDYLEGLLLISERADFDSLAHIDLVKRYAHRQGIEIRIEKEEKIVRRILRLLVERGKFLEVNTSSLRQNFEECLPSDEILSWYAEEGGKFVTLGSDSHRTDDIASGMQEAEKHIAAFGLNILRKYRRNTEVV